MTQDGIDAQVLRCPRCGFDYIRIVSVSVSAGQSFLVLAEYQCEDCQGGTLKFDLHKGQTFIEGA